ncbi:MAG: DUF5606 domain-containing protein [Bacteroidota bacterium]
MSFEKIISVPGSPGLYKMVAQMRNGGFVVEGISDNKRMPVSATQRIVMLKDVAIYTYEEDMPLYDAFKKMKGNDKLATSVNAKSEPADLKEVLKKVLPEYDEERVHISDIRKIFSWYNLIKDLVGSPESEAAMNPSNEVVEEKVEEVKEVVEEKVEKAKAPKKRAAKKSAEKES